MLICGHEGGGNGRTMVDSRGDSKVSCFIGAPGGELVGGGGQLWS